MVILFKRLNFQLFSEGGRALYVDYSDILPLFVYFTSPTNVPVLPTLLFHYSVSIFLTVVSRTMTERHPQIQARGAAFLTHPEPAKAPLRRAT